MVRLTTMASLNFSKYSRDGRYTFLDELRGELAEILSLENSSLQASHHWQWDPANNWQILLKFTIYPRKEANISVSRIIDALNELILNRDISLISLYPRSSQLDSDYGFVKKRKYLYYVHSCMCDIWEQYKYRFYTRICYTHLNTHFIFEYFYRKCMGSLWIQIVRDWRGIFNNSHIGIIVIQEIKE